MAEPVKPPEGPSSVQQFEPVTDPYNVAPVFVTSVGAVGQASGVGNLVLLTYRILPAEGRNKLDPVVCARLRFDLPIAIQMRDALEKIILDATAKTEGKGH